ncbi:hypothetical protein WICPIJ_004232 [Wickerhamomyces pijperi]|uniref:Uncharacterized protein n=1 Tax=Wickerhamomyces pijperi TaxID=599730 RepID=A0A9P8TM78_WICPI|nr:hypothetical protein WICPIJ_004232 [Wickerhamomyces pijperi]
MVEHQFSMSTLAHSGKETSVNSPGDGLKSLTGFSAYNLASMEAPVTSILVFLKSGAWLAAIFNIHSTKSKPVTASVTGCSTFSKTFGKSSNKSTFCKPIPPPPAVDFNMTLTEVSGSLDKPKDLANAMASSTSAIKPEPGTKGTLALAAISLAECLRPSFLIESPEGPTKTIPSRSQRSANSAFSERKP